VIKKSSKSLKSFIFFTILSWLNIGFDPDLEPDFDVLKFGSGTNIPQPQLDLPVPDYNTG
jgi:hypothetical protein